MFRCSGVQVFRCFRAYDWFWGCRVLGFQWGRERGPKKRQNVIWSKNRTCSNGVPKKSQNVIWGKIWAGSSPEKCLKPEEKWVRPKKRQNVIRSKNCTCSKGGPKKRQNVIWGKTALVQNYQALLSSVLVHQWWPNGQLPGCVLSECVSRNRQSLTSVWRSSPSTMSVRSFEFGRLFLCTSVSEN